MKAPASPRAKVIVTALAVAVVIIVAVPVLSPARRPPARVPPTRVPEGAWAEGQLHREERLSPTLEVLKALARRKRAPTPGQWLAEHPEPGQLVSEFLASAPDAGWPVGRAFYVTTIGPLTESEERLVEDTRALLAAWFQHPVERLPALPSTVVAPRFRRDREHGPQWETTPILDVLSAQRPADAIAVMAFTAVDLYPDPAWNYVFGEANLETRVGVMSLARHGAADSPLGRTRALGTAAHELGHMLGVLHCVAFECVMNGSNSLEEADLAPLTLCPACLEKLRVRLGVDARARARVLEPALRDAGFDEAANHLAAELAVWASRDAGP